MKRSPVLALIATLAVAGILGQDAMAASSKLGASAQRATLSARSSGVAHGSIGKAPPSANAASSIRALGLEDDSALGSDDSGGVTSTGTVAHGSIGSAPPSANAAGSIRALGSEDDSALGSDDGGGVTSTATVAHGSIGKSLPSANAAGRIRALGLGD